MKRFVVFHEIEGKLKRLELKVKEVIYKERYVVLIDIKGKPNIFQDFKNIFEKETGNRAEK